MCAAPGATGPPPPQWYGHGLDADEIMNFNENQLNFIENQLIFNENLLIFIAHERSAKLTDAHGCYASVSVHEH